MRCALYFGSFNPLHIGHITIARYVLACTNIDCFRFVLSPHNPMKNIDILADPHERLARLRLEIEQLNRTGTLPSEKHLEVSDVEFALPKPLYTYHTLSYLQREEPETEFIFIMGADSLAMIESWYHWKQLLNEFEVWVYPRRGYDAMALCKKYGTRYLDGELIDISSTELRSQTQA